jgi:single-strand DNA-binding protein
MANDLNQCNFIGRLGADPDSRYLSNGDAVCNFRIAVGWKGKEKEGAEWVPCTAYGKLAEICGEYLRKGSQVFVSGRFITRKWQDKDGNDRYTSEINLDRMQMLGSKAGSDTDRPAAPSREPASKPAPSGGVADMESDIPF